MGTSRAARRSPPPGRDPLPAPTVTLGTLADITPDDKNANLGTERGAQLIENSLRKFGGARSIVLDRNNQIIAGNKTIEGAAAIGLENLIIIETDGSQIVAVKRTDIDLNTARGRELALADNRTAEENLDWSAEVLRELLAEDVNLAELWTAGELPIVLDEYAGQGLDANIHPASQFHNMDFRQDESRNVLIEFGEIATNLPRAYYDRLLAVLKTYPSYRDGLLAAFDALMNHA